MQKKDMSKEKQNKRRFSKTAVITAASVAGIACVTGGTLAYFIGTRNVVNTQTVGKVSIKTTEPSFPTKDDNGDGIPDECEKLTPYKEISKDPQITNTGKDDVVVFFKVTAPVEAISLVDENGKSTATSTDLYWFKQASDAATSHKNNFNSNWVFLSAVSSAKSAADSTGSTIVNNVAVKQNGTVVTTNNEKTGITYVFGYKTRLAPGQTTATLFDKIQNKKYGSANIGPDESESIIVESYAIQADDVLKEDSGTTGHVTNSTGDISEDDLTYIYNTFINQNTDALATN